MSYYCRQWRLKPSAAKTVVSCFYLHNVSACRQLSVLLDRQHKVRAPAHILACNTRSYALLQIPPDQDRGQIEEQEQPANEARWLNWGADADTPLALCYSAGEYCAPVWCRSAHTGLVDAQLNSTMRLISGTPPNSASVATSRVPTGQGKLEKVR